MDNMEVHSNHKQHALLGAAAVSRFYSTDFDGTVIYVPGFVPQHSTVRLLALTRRSRVVPVTELATHRKETLLHAS
jgi:hypothetical protein